MDENVDRGVLESTTVDNQDQRRAPIQFDMDQVRNKRERELIMEEIQQLGTHCKVIIQPAMNTPVEVLQASLEFLLSHLDQLNALNRLLWADSLVEVRELRADRAQQNTLILETRVLACQMKRAIENAERLTESEPTTSETGPPRASCCGSSKNARKLEPLKMDKFDGNLENWLSWWSRFEDRIHHDPQLNDRTKYDYLLQYLSKEVRDRLKTIPLDESFYEAAISRLRVEFGNPEKLLTLYTRRLATLRPILSRFDVTAMREMLQVVHTSLSALEKVGMARESLAPSVFQSLKENLPLGVYLDFKASQRLERSAESTDTANSSIATTDRLNKLLAFVEAILLDLDDVPEVQLQRQAAAETRKTVPATIALKTEVRQIPNRINEPIRKLPTNNEQPATQQSCVFCKSSEHRTQACTDTTTSVQQKRDLLMKEDRCCKCSKKGHRAVACRSAPYCSKCQKKGHMTPLCNPISTFTAHCSGDRSGRQTHGCSHGRSSTQYYITVMATAIGPAGRRRRVRILFDSGSQSSFVRTEVAEKMGIDMQATNKIPVSLKMLNHATVLTNTSEVDIRLQNEAGGPIKNFKFYTLQEICGGQVQPAIDPKTRDQLRKLNVELSDDNQVNAPIDILIGADQLVCVQTHNAHRLERALEVVETAFGWALFGGRELQRTQEIAVNHMNVMCLHCTIPQIEPVEPEESLDQRFRRFVEADALAIEKETRDVDEDFIQNFMENVSFNPETHRFTADLPVKDGLKPGINRNLARARLRSLERSLARSNTRGKYEAEIQSLISLGFVEEVDDGKEPEGPVSYLPHKAVIKEDSLTTKLRIVFDASAKERGSLSLNDVLECGPNLTQDMLAVLLRFRTQNIVVLADIEKSFPQVIIREPHRDMMRFMWNSAPSGEPQTYRLTRNYFGFASSSFILAACIKTLLRWFEKKYPQTVAEIQKNYYVDDIAAGASSEEEAIELYTQTKEIFNHGSFNLRKWMSNSRVLMSLFRKNGDGVEEFNVSSWYNVLGLQYNPVTDSIRLKVGTIGTVPDLVTKRTVLSAIASVFDRIGIVAPLLVPAKLLMQKLWTLNLAWDDPVPEQVRSDFRKWTEELRGIESIVIPRRYWQGSNPTSTTLHVFCDASKFAYGFCAYAVTESNGSVRSSLILAKSRVAPLRNATIPRLELMALTLAAEATSYIREQSNFKFQEEHLWTDNSGVFFQATSEHPEKLPTFARNRVAKIQSHVRHANIHHVPGSMNPADLVSRGCTFEEFMRSEWLTGPEFIRGKKESWPNLSDQVARQIQVNRIEMKTTHYESFVAARTEAPVEVRVNFAESSAEQIGRRVTLQFGTCSRWTVYLRAVVRFRRAIDFWKKRLGRDSLNKPILTAELLQAERLIISQVQLEAYGAEISALSTDSPVQKSSALRVFNPSIRDGLLVLGGRLGSNVGELPKHPIILPPRHHITKLILKDMHERNGHAGTSQVLITSRQKYWIPQGRRVIQNIIHACGSCWRFHAKPVTTTVGEPPDVRVSRSQAFEHVGTDVLGPLYIKDGNQQRKIWVVIFTCCAMRAIHLEMLNSLNTTEFLMSLRRFKARRGCPRTFYSDNAKAYKRAAEDLKALCEVMGDPSIQERLASEGIEWKFAVEKAPWYMGFTERLIGSVKSTLKKVLGRASVDWQEMSTILCEVEMMVNRRPLCQVPESEHVDVLTPFHFLVARTNDPAEDSLAPRKLRASELLKRWRHKKHIVETVWTRWQHEYLLLLRNFHETVPKDLKTIELGQVVIIKDPNRPKLFWRMGRVMKLNVSRDNVVRSCMLKVGNGRMLQRPLSLLYPLEVV